MTMRKRRRPGRPHPALSVLFIFVSHLATAAVVVVRGQHVYTDSFPTYEEYDYSILDPLTVYGSPYGGFSRATRSALASLPLHLPHVWDETPSDDPLYMQVRDATGRLFACRVYHEDELQPESLFDSMFNAAKLSVPAAGDDDEEEEEASTDEGGAKAASSEGTEKKQQETPHSAKAILDGEKTDRKQGVGGTTTTSKAASRNLQGASTKNEGVIKDEVDKKKLESQDSSTISESSSSDVTEDDVKALVSNRLMDLVGICGQVHKGWWSYEWCFERQVSQFHVEISHATGEIRIDDTSNLGAFDERTIEVIRKDNSNNLPPNENAEDTPELARVVDVHSGGDTCPDTGTDRVSYVHMMCCSSRILERQRGLLHQNGRQVNSDIAAILDLREDKEAVCTYNVTVCTPLLCGASDEESSGGSGGASGGSANKNSKGSGKTKTSSGALRENASVREILDNALSDLCLQTSTGGWWTYEICHGSVVKQFHEIAGIVTSVSNTYTQRMVDHEHNLGHYDAEAAESFPDEDEWKHVVNATDGTKGGVAGGGGGGGSSNGAYFALEYTGGDPCDHHTVTDAAIVAGSASGAGGVVERASSVRYYCGSNFDVSVNEDSTCHYIVEVKVPDLCEHPLFKAPVSKRQVVKCLPVENE